MHGFRGEFNSRNIHFMDLTPYIPEIKKYIRRFAKGEEAEDVLQETLLQALKSKTVPRCPLAWAKTIARRVAIAYWRQRRHSYALSFDIAAAEPAEPQADFDKGIATLTPRQQLIVTLHYYDGMGIKAIATKLKVSTKEIKSTLHEALAKLQDFYTH